MKVQSALSLIYVDESLDKKPVCAMLNNNVTLVLAPYTKSDALQIEHYAGILKILLWTGYNI